MMAPYPHDSTTAPHGEDHNSPGQSLCYDRLGSGQIRILYLSPGKDDDPILCQLVTYPIECAPDYEALSYVWHQKPSPRSKSKGEDVLIKIKSDGMESFVQKKVKWNLGVALKTLRLTDQYRRLWTDSLCINQVDNIEMSAQILQMGDIYGQSSNVIAWLGEDDADLSETLAKVKIFNFPKVDDATAAEFITAIARSVFFQRIWILQEVVLGKQVTVVCGEESAEWDQIGMLTENVDEGPLHISDFFHWKDVDMITDSRIAIRKVLRHVQMLRFQRQENWRYEPPRLLSLVQKFRELGCTWPQDRVYANLAMGAVHDRQANSERTYKAQRDHVDALPDDQCIFENGTMYVLRQYTPCSVYARLVITDMSTYKRLDALNCHTGLRDESFPSWVPNFNSGNDTYSLIDRFGEWANHWFYQQEKMYAASGDSEPDIELLDPLESVRRIAIGGFLLDRVKSVGHLFTLKNPMDLDQGLSHFVDWAQETSNTYRSWSSDFYGSEDENRFEDALQRTAVAGKIVGRKTLEEIQERTRQLTDDSFVNVACSSLPAAWAAHCNRRPICTSFGMIGIGPKDAEPGDAICILFGGQTPYVVKMRLNGSYELKGECYIEGIMDGAAYDAFVSRIEPNTTGQRLVFE